LVQQASCRGCLDAFLHDQDARSKIVNYFVDILDSKPEQLSPNHIMTDSDIATAHKDGEELEIHDYAMLIQYLNSTGHDYHSVYSVTSSTDCANVLPRCAQMPPQFKHDTRTYSINLSHNGNSQIRFYIPGGTAESKATGYIEKIFKLPLAGFMRTFLQVRHHQPLGADELQYSPYTYEPCTYLKTKLVSPKASNQIQIIEPQHIICHLAVYKLQQGTYTLNKPALVVNWALNRKRH
jgi:hypothetical protein